MSPRREVENVGVRHGAWGETVATDFLRRRGYLIVDSNARPVEKDRRLEIDLVAWDESTDTMVFVEVKQHAAPTDYSRRLRSIDRRSARTCGGRATPGGASTNGAGASGST